MSASHYSLRITRQASPLVSSAPSHRSSEGSDHPDLGGMEPALATDGSVVLRTGAEDTPPLRVQLSGNQSTLSVQGAAGEEGLLSLRGPSGRGPYRLWVSREVRPYGIGSRIYHDDWVTAPTDSLEELRLSIGHDDINDGYWVAWRDGDGGEEGEGAAWALYWVTPRPYNKGDLEGGVQVGLALRREG